MWKRTLNWDSNHMSSEIVKDLKECVLIRETFKHAVSDAGIISACFEEMKVTTEDPRVRYSWTFHIVAFWVTSDTWNLFFASGSLSRLLGK